MSNTEGPKLPTATLDKYKAAGQVASQALSKVISAALPGAKVLDLGALGDQVIEEGTSKLYNKVKGLPKGIAFPTTLSLNNTIQNFSPTPSDAAAAKELVAGDVVKILLGAHFDGYAVLSAETIVVGDDKASGTSADLVSAAHFAAEAALRTIQPGAKNWEATEVIKKVVDQYEGVSGVETILSHEFTQNDIEAKKGLIAFPSSQQRADSSNTYIFEEGEVYGLNIVVTTGNTTPKADESRTTIYQRTNSTYLLKMKASRAVFSEISRKAGRFPFTLRTLDDESKARMGIRECVQHGLLKPFDILTTDKPSDVTAQVFVTFAVSKNGVVRLSAENSSLSRVASSTEIKDEALKALLARPLKIKAKKTPKAEESK